MTHKANPINHNPSQLETMTGFTDKDFVDVWLSGAKKGRNMKIDSDSVRATIKREIEREQALIATSEARIVRLRALRNNPRYFTLTE